MQLGSPRDIDPQAICQTDKRLQSKDIQSQQHFSHDFFGELASLYTYLDPNNYRTTLLSSAPRLSHFLATLHWLLRSTSLLGLFQAAKNGHQCHQL